MKFRSLPIFLLFFVTFSIGNVAYADNSKKSCILKLEHKYRSEFWKYLDQNFTGTWPEEKSLRNLSFRISRTVPPRIITIPNVSEKNPIYEKVKPYLEENKINPDDNTQNEKLEFDLENCPADPLPEEKPHMKYCSEESLGIFQTVSPLIGTWEDLGGMFGKDTCQLRLEASLEPTLPSEDGETIKGKLRVGIRTGDDVDWDAVKDKVKYKVTSINITPKNYKDHFKLVDVIRDGHDREDFEARIPSKGSYEIQLEISVNNCPSVSLVRPLKISSVTEREVPGIKIVESGRDTNTRERDCKAEIFEANKVLPFNQVQKEMKVTCQNSPDGKLINCNETYNTRIVLGQNIESREYCIHNWFHPNKTWEKKCATCKPPLNPKEQLKITQVASTMDDDSISCEISITLDGKEKSVKDLVSSGYKAMWWYNGDTVETIGGDCDPARDSCTYKIIDRLRPLKDKLYITIGNERHDCKSNVSDDENTGYSLTSFPDLEDEILECRIEIQKDGKKIESLEKEGLSLKWFSDGSHYRGCGSKLYCSGNVTEDFENISIGLFKGEKRVARTDCASSYEEDDEGNECLKLKVTSKTENRVALKAIKKNGAKGAIKWWYSGLFKEECKYGSTTIVCPRFKCFDRTIKAKLIKNGVVAKRKGEKCVAVYENPQKGCPDPEAPDPYVPYSPVILPPPLNYFHSGFN